MIRCVRSAKKRKKKLPLSSVVRIVLQKVKHASVSINDAVAGKINHGLLLLVGITHEDGEKDADWLVEKIIKLRIFSDGESGSFMEKNIIDVDGELLLVSQFTVYGDCKKGTKPSFTASARPETAYPLYEYLVKKFRQTGIKTETGRFGSYMDVALVNDGPVTLILDTKEKS